MQALLESIRKLELLNADPQSAELRERFLLLRETIAARLKGASQAEAAFFRLVVQALTQSPPHVVPDIRAEIILDIAQYFYFSGLPFEAIEPLKKAEMLAGASNQLALVHRAANTLGVIYADTGNLAKAIEKHSQALDAAQKLGDDVAQAKTWGNIGAALHYCARSEEHTSEIQSR